MIKEDFVFNMTLKFSANSKDEKKIQKNKLFAEELYTFAKECPEQHLQEVFNFASRSRKDNFLFSLKLLYDFAEQMGFIAKHEFKKKRIVWWWNCTKCGLKYSSQGRSCPTCGSLGAFCSIDPKGNHLLSEVVLVQDDCSICKIYDTRNEDGNYVFGPECNSFGKGTKPFGKQCADCTCKLCCDMTYSMKRNEEAFRLRLIDGKIQMPWIDMDKQSGGREELLGNIEKLKQKNPTKRKK